MANRTNPNHCPCNSGMYYRDCCRPIHRSEVNAQTAEQLMRSRYSAYVRNLIPYLHQSWAVSTRPEIHILQSGHNAALQWLGLEIVAIEAGQPGDMTGIVEFKAQFTESGVNSVLYERSHFIFEDETWFYLKAE